MTVSDFDQYSRQYNELTKLFFFKLGGQAPRVQFDLAPHFSASQRHEITKQLDQSIRKRFDPIIIKYIELNDQEIVDHLLIQRAKNGLALLQAFENSPSRPVLLATPGLD